MSAPLSFDRVLAALRRLFPIDVTITRPAGALPAAGDSGIGKELGTLAWMAARVTDRVEVLAAELFPDTATESIARWEKVFRTSSNAASPIATRRAKVLSVMRRSGGVQNDRLRRMLYSVLGLTDPNQVDMFESTRLSIDNALINDTGVIALALPGTLSMGKPWPGLVDDLGVRLYVQFNGYTPGSPSLVTVTAPNGAVWSFNQTAAGLTTYENRTSLTGGPAGGVWTVSATSNGAATQITRCKLLVSNNVDSGQIYYYYAYRDPGLPGTPDLVESQRLFNRTALGHMTTAVIQSAVFLCDDPHSLTDRDPVGG